MKTDFFRWYIEKSNEYKGLTNPATAAKLIGISTQHLNRIVEMGRINKIYYGDMPFIGLTEVFEEIQRREAKEHSKNEIGGGLIPFIYPREELREWLNELHEKYKCEWGGATEEQQQEFLDKKLKEWKKENPDKAKKLAERLKQQMDGTYDPI